ncbi:hypothetical protein OROGR_000144 [Orobanche gracilis]
MGLADNTKKGVENLPIKRREPVELREITVERRLEALETRVEILLEQFEEIKLLGKHANVTTKNAEPSFDDNPNSSIATLRLTTSRVTPITTR